MKKEKSDDELFFEKWSNEKYCIEAVKQYGDALQYVREQSEAICTEAVKQNGYALQYVRERKIFEKILGILTEKAKENSKE